jgi:hypothetical protein
MIVLAAGEVLFDLVSTGKSRAWAGAKERRGVERRKPPVAFFS